METNKTKIKPQSMIVVEGKTDTAKLQKIYGPELKTIETSGMGLNAKTLDLIKTFAQNYTIIVFTDPDGPGKKIREAVNLALDGAVENAFISKEAISPQGKIGIAEADEAAIIAALDNLVTFNQTGNSLSWGEYLAHDFHQPFNRQRICDYYHFDPKIRNKTLFKWLNWMNLSAQDVAEILKWGGLKDGQNNC